MNVAEKNTLETALTSPQKTTSLLAFCGLDVLNQHLIQDVTPIIASYLGWVSAYACPITISDVTPFKNLPKSNVKIDGNNIVILDSKTGKSKTLEHTQPIIFIAPNHDESKIATYAQDSCIRIWDTVQGTQLLKIDFPDAKRIAFSYDSSLIAVSSQNSSVKIFDTITGDVQQYSRPLFHEQKNMVFHPNNSKLLTYRSNDRGGSLWECQSIPRESFYKIGRGPATFSADGTYLIGENYLGSINVWDLVNPDQKPFMQLHGQTREARALSATNSKVIATFYNQTGVWDLNSGYPIATLLHPPEQDILCTALTNNEKEVAAVTTNRKRFSWKMPNLTELDDISLKQAGLLLLLGNQKNAEGEPTNLGSLAAETKIGQEEIVATLNSFPTHIYNAIVQRYKICHMLKKEKSTPTSSQPSSSLSS